MSVSPAQLAQATARLNSDLSSLSPQFIVIRNAVRNYRTGNDPYLIDLGGTILSALNTGFSITTDTLTIIYDTPGFLQLAKASGALSVVTTFTGLTKYTIELGVSILNRKSTARSIFFSTC